MPQPLYNLLAPVVEDMGYELWHLERVGGNQASLLRLYIESDGGIDLGDCEKVSREVNAVLEAEDSANAALELEVSSPGLDRPLVTPGHFERFIGERARVKMYAPVAGQRKFRGEICKVRGQVVDLDCDDQIFSLPISDMAKASLEPVFEK